MEKPQGHFYFSFSSEVSTRTSSQTCGRWYLPTFLFRDGSLTLIYRASFIVLIWFKSSLPIILKKDQSRMILTTDKGVALVVLNTEDYIKKAEDLLNQNTYRVLTSDPTMKFKNKIINLLKAIKSKGGITEELYRRLYPTGAGSPEFYGLPKIHKPGMPLRPIVSSIGAVTYQTSKEVARILRPLVGKSIHHVKNTQDFLDSIKGINLGKDQCMMSYDVKALFTSVPTKKASNIIKQMLEEDQELSQRTALTIENIISLLEFCITST